MTYIENDFFLELARKCTASSVTTKENVAMCEIITEDERDWKLARFGGFGDEFVSSIWLPAMAKDRVEGESERSPHDSIMSAILDQSPKSALTLLQEEHSHEKLFLVEHSSFPLHLGLTSLAGPAGSGKTQICLSTLADCAWKKRKAVYISIGSNTLIKTSKRLLDMLQNRKSFISSENINNQNNAQSIKEEYLSLIHLNWVRNQEDLIDLLRNNLPRLLKLHPTISVVILDGIATLFRGYKQENETLKNPWQDRSSKFFQISSSCKALSFEYRVPFLVTNEATSRITSNTSVNDKSNLEPALGLSWSQSINTSLFVTRGSSLTAGDSVNRRRILRCLKSPHTSSKRSAEFTIESHGATRIK